MGLHLIRDHLQAQTGIHSEIYYENLRFYDRLPVSFSFDALREFFWDNPCIFWFCEGMFAPFAFEAPVKDIMVNKYLKFLKDLTKVDLDDRAFPNRLLSWISMNYYDIEKVMTCSVPKFLQESAENLISQDPRVVGFTCFFNQLLPALALSKSIKSLSPDTITVLGGAGIECEGAGPLLRLFDQVDVIVCGDGETAIVRLVEAVRGDSLSDLEAHQVYTRPNLARRGRYLKPSNKGKEPTGTDTDIDINQLGPIDFTEFHKAHRLSRFAENVSYYPFEISRGCYWMYKSKCTFCGIKDGFRFQNKRAEAILQDITSCIEKYNASYFVCVDSALPHSHARRTIPQIAKRLSRYSSKFSFFFELRVDIEREVLEGFSRLGSVAIQPGIESFSTTLLRRMRKGTTALQNVQFLRWCRELGIVPYYNILFGFPGERPDDYEQTRQILPKIVHLGAPLTITRLMMLRNSPMWRERDGVTDVMPWNEYRFLFPTASDTELNNIAYYFSYQAFDAYGQELELPDDLIEFVTLWKRLDASKGTYLMHHVGASRDVTIWDNRQKSLGVVDREVCYRFSSPVYARILEGTDELTSWSALSERLGAELGRGAEANSAAEDLAAIGVLLFDDDACVRTSVPA
jgi:ribosomal peptide maturation radical SAM protein 1